MKIKPHSLLLALAATGLVASALPHNKDLPADRITTKNFPSIFQAWNPLDQPDQYPLKTNADRLKAAAKHDVIWEEPISQLGFKTDLVLGAVWDHKYPGLAEEFTKPTLQLALANRKALLEMNPSMVFLFEVRWRDAPGSFLPEDSPFWKRDASGKRVLGWDNGPEPYYLLNPENAAFQANIARQCKAAIASGVYDGIMLDWSGHEEIIRQTRASIGEQGLIIVNIHDDIEDSQRFKNWINGAFMECNPNGPGKAADSNRTTWDKLRAGYLYHEQNLRWPQLNCLEVWGDRKDLRRMRATTTLALTHGNGSALYADPNPLASPDHLHDWYAFWDIKLGKPKGGRIDRADGLAQREFMGGTVLYNHFGHGTVTVNFEQPRKRASTGETGTQFSLQDADGDIFTNP